MSEALRATVRTRTNLLSLFIEPLLEASLAEMLTTAIREVGFIQHSVRTNKTGVLVWWVVDKTVVLHSVHRGIVSEG